jgi:hypothetical protein
MRNKFKLERVTGVVALSYLVLIPVGAVIVWQKVRIIDRDVTTLWEKAGLEAADAAAGRLHKFREVFRR